MLNSHRTPPKACLCSLWRVLCLQPFALCPSELRLVAGQHAVTQLTRRGRCGRLQVAKLPWERPGARHQVGERGSEVQPLPSPMPPTLEGWVGPQGAARLDLLREADRCQGLFVCLGPAGLPQPGSVLEDPLACSCSGLPSVHSPLERVGRRASC